MIPERQEETVVFPGWLPFWLTGLPAAFVLSPLGLLGLPYLRILPRGLLYLFGGYALCQVLPAVFAPTPLLALGGALLRTALLGGLLGLGAVMGQLEQLRPLAVGLTGVYLTALVFNLSVGLDLFSGRLSHPYMTPITLGLAGAMGLWLAVFLRGHWGWRIFLGLAGAASLLFSGSRGPLLAALFGLLTAYVLQKRPQTYLVLITAGLLFGLSLTLGDRVGVNLLSRLTQIDTTGRDVVWSNTLSVIRAHPLVGVGSYQLGAELTPPGQPCALVNQVTAQEESLTKAACPAWIARLRNPWLIAHNVSLQQLAETGPLGLLGLMMLLTTVTVVTLSRREPLAVAVVSGLLLATVLDNTLLVPSPFFAEVFWLVAGTQLRHMETLPSSWKVGLAGTGLTLALSIPIWMDPFLRHPRIPAVAETAQLHYFHAPRTNRVGVPYTTSFQFALPDGAYRAVLLLCTDHCVTLADRPLTVQSGHSELISLHSQLGTSSEQRLTLQLLPAQATFQRTVLAEKTWTVRPR